MSLITLKMLRKQKSLIPQPQIARGCSHSVQPENHNSNGGSA